MTCLTVYHDNGSALPISTITDTDEIACALAAFGVVYERRPARAGLPANASDHQALAAYRDDIAQINANRHFGAIDVYRIGPDAPNRSTARLSFLAEHTHSDDEVRFMVEGRGAFHLHLGDQVFQLVCGAGDLLNVPAGTPHWFDMGRAPRFTAIRFLGAPVGWVARFTGHPVAAQLPSFDATPASVA